MDLDEYVEFMIYLLDDTLFCSMLFVTCRTRAIITTQ